jgi:hypothetical protein
VTNRDEILNGGTGPFKPFEDPELHALAMNCFTGYQDAFYASNPHLRPTKKEDAAWLRKINGEPEPFGKQFQERLLQTLIVETDFQAAVKNILGIKG